MLLTTVKLMIVLNGSNFVEIEVKTKYRRRFLDYAKKYRQNKKIMALWASVFNGFKLAFWGTLFLVLKTILLSLFFLFAELSNCSNYSLTKTKPLICHLIKYSGL